jgi:hypothetical protein
MTNRVCERPRKNAANSGSDDGSPGIRKLGSFRTIAPTDGTRLAWPFPSIRELGSFGRRVTGSEMTAGLHSGPKLLRWPAVVDRAVCPFDKEMS